ncbi:MAG: hypothetical protein Q8N19_02440 [Phenylobacterium sp.]|uniref:hypothetical protein n=1 Tax=Phenylobacterium sp. TaxID=1871053 RepID=UPI002736D3B9|nr:hypothetical protein [Phenylobacterium sp.]MDP3115953.1 hypothetical protein [Phenylobacterium sp.]
MDFEVALKAPFRWPKAGDKLFRVSPAWDGNAVLADHPHSRMVLMMSGYKRGADLMVEQATDYRPDRDTLVFPIIFNYRQFLELSLKYLVSTYGRTVDVDPIWNSHDLTKLWARFEEVLAGYGSDDADGATAAVAQIVAEFATVDPGSFSHRYPVDTKGRPMELTHEYLDLATLADVMNAVDGFFSGCDGYLDALQSAGP